MTDSPTTCPACGATVTSRRNHVDRTVLVCPTHGDVWNESWLQPGRYYRTAQVTPEQKAAARRRVTVKFIRAALKAKAPVTAEPEPA